MKVIFRPLVYRRFRAYINLIDVEISGFGKVRKEGDNLYIEDVRIFNQVVTGGNTILDGRAIQRFSDELEAEGEDFPTDWKLWWHSHVEMQALFSQTDHDTIDDFDSQMVANNWMLSIVTNKYSEYSIRADIYAPLRCTISHIPWDVQVGQVTDELYLEAVQKEIEEKVVVRTPQIPSQQTISFFGKRDSTIGQRILSVEEREKLRKQFPHLFPLQLPQTSITNSQTNLILDESGKPIN